MRERSTVAAVLALPGADPADPDDLALDARALRVAVIACCTGDLLYDGVWRVGLPLLGCLGLALVPRCLRLASVLAFAAMTGLIAFSLPVVANHDHLKWLLLLLFVFLRVDEPREQRLLLQAGRWLLVLVFLWSGVKKALFGTYFEGEYLAYMIATSHRFSDFFSLLLPAEEIARLQGYGGEVGTGPYAVEGLVLPVFANAIWIGEIAVALALVWPPLRRIGWLLGLALLIGIELVAREVFFGLLFATLLLTFPSASLLPRATPWLIALQGVLVLGSLAGLVVPGLT